MDFNADPDLAFHANADPDKNNAHPDPQPLFFPGPFWPAWDRIPNPDPDRLTQLNPEAPIRIRIRHTVYMGP